MRTPFDITYVNLVKIDRLNIATNLAFHYLLSFYSLNLNEVIMIASSDFDISFSEDKRQDNFIMPITFDILDYLLDLLF